MTKQALQNKMSAYIDGEAFNFKRDLILLLNWKLSQPAESNTILVETALLFNRISTNNAKLSLLLSVTDYKLILMLYTDYPNSDDLFCIEIVHTILNIISFYSNREQDSES